MLLPLAGSAQINVEQVTRIGQNALYFDDYMVAIQYFNRAIAARPYWYKPYLYRAIAKLNLGDYAGAEADASLAIERHQHVPDAYEVRAVARQNLGLNTDAITDYARVLDNNPDNSNVLYNMSLALVDVERYDEARQNVAMLMRRYPKFDGTYFASARVNVATGDTIAALADLDKALEANFNSTNSYLMRAEINLHRACGVEKYTPERRELDSLALADMDAAVRLLPNSAPLYTNRAYIRYTADDYTGAMSDFDKALEIDPTNIIALYNRAMLRTEVHDYNHAIEDFTEVINQNPRQYRAVFNRANLYRELGDWSRALDDINTVIDAFPDFAAALYLRAEIQYNRGNTKAAARDRDRSVALARKKVVMLPDEDVGTPRYEANDSTGIFGEDQEAVAERFQSLQMVDNLSSAPRDYSGSTRGNIQDTDFAVRLEPMFTISYYYTETELSAGTDFLRDLEQVSEALHEPVYLVSHEPPLRESDMRERAASVEYYDSWIATHTPRAVDYLGRGLDRQTLHDYASAVADFDRALTLSPAFAPALLMRGVARWRQAEALAADTDPENRDARRMQVETLRRASIDDFDAATSAVPSMAIAYYNKGVVLASARQWRQAYDAFSKALEINPEMAQACYNRGYVNMTLGNKQEAFADLSRAGELGIAPAYNLMKRMSR